LLDRVAKGCTKVAKGNYKSDGETAADILLCKAGSAYVWKADMDVDCDGIKTDSCHHRKDLETQVFPGRPDALLRDSAAQP
jgi:hypothetical protein